MLSQEAALFRKLTWRIIPVLMICYVIAFLERVNVGFAALTMNHDLGFSATVFGTGAGMFSVGYLLFEIPLSILFNRFGARVTFSRTMIVWGLVACATAFVSNATSFFILRFLLGVAEAGFSPGVLVYMSWWFPQKYRGRMLSYFMLSLPLSSFIGSPISGYLVGLPDFLGLQGWEIMFLAEGIPAIIMAFVVWLTLTERPENATWLSNSERNRVAAELALDSRPDDTAGMTLWQTLCDRRVLMLSLAYLGAILVHTTLAVWMPQMIRASGFTVRETGLLAMLPYFFGIVGMIAWGRHSDRKSERCWHTVAAMLLAASGLIAAATMNDPVFRIIAVCFAMTGSFSALSVFWTMPTGFLAGRGAVGGIALISSVGNLAGLIGPYVVGVSKDRTGSYSAGLVGIAFMCIAATVLIIAVNTSAQQRSSLGGLV